ncbi:hypothetical protein Tco_0627397 [Tanacetum coccineum]|uniref:Uncharacterized protein n=1 Tax=Tanacetum coccineum TaxID=301880 RepID=A0ABQ4WMF0_9ASTR
MVILMAIHLMIQYLGNPVKEIPLKRNLPDHRIKQRWRYLIPMESIYHPMLTLNVSNLSASNLSAFIIACVLSYDSIKAMVASSSFCLASLSSSSNSVCSTIIILPLSLAYGSCDACEVISFMDSDGAIRGKAFGGNKESKKTQKKLLKQQYMNFQWIQAEKDFSNQAHGSNSANTDRDCCGDLREMDLKVGRMAMLTMRGQKITNRMEGSKGEHEQRTYKEECDSGNNKDKRLVAQDDWVWTRDSEVSTCSKACLKSYETLKEHYDNLTKDFNKSQLHVRAYKAGLGFVEAGLDVYKKNEVIFEEGIKNLKLDIKLRDNSLTKLRKKFEKAKKERDDLKLTLEKFENSSKNLSKLLKIEVKGIMQFHLPTLGTSCPPKPNLILANEEEYVFSESKPKSVSKPLIKDRISDSRVEMETVFKSN